MTLKVMVTVRGPRQSFDVTAPPKEWLVTTDSITTGRDIARAYLATWNATEEQERRRLLERHWAPDVTYVDPMAAVSGRDGDSADVAGVHDQFPNFVFSPVGEIDAHHDQLRFQWGLGPVGVQSVVIGFDVVVLDRDGRIHDVRGFLDQVRDQPFGKR